MYNSFFLIPRNLLDSQFERITPSGMEHLHIFKIFNIKVEQTIGTDRNAEIIKNETGRF